MPEGEYPRVNDGKAMENRLYTYRRMAIINVAKRFATLLVSCLVASAALYGYRIWIYVHPYAFAELDLEPVA